MAPYPFPVDRLSGSILYSITWDEPEEELEALDRYSCGPGLKHADGWRYVAKDSMAAGGAVHLFTHKPFRRGIGKKFTWAAVEGACVFHYLSVQGLGSGQCCRIDYSVDEQARDRRGRDAD